MEPCPGVQFVGHELMTQLNGHWAFTTDRGFDVVANFGGSLGIGALKDVSTTDSGTFNRNISAKLASSVAHVYKKNGSMLEQYTPGFETDMKMPAARETGTSRPRGSMRRWISTRYRG